MIPTGSDADYTDPSVEQDIPVNDVTQAPTGAPADEYLIDLDGDGVADGYGGTLPEIGAFEVLDQDADGSADTLLIDLDADGSADMSVIRSGDTFEVSVDLDADGYTDETLTLTAEEFAAQFPVLTGFFPDLAMPDGDATDGVDVPPEGDVPSGDPTVDEDGRIVGDPWAASEFWFEQSFNGSCLPASVAQIYEAYTGEDVTDLDFVSLVNESGGWVVGPDGAPGLMPESAVQLLDTVGIPAELVYSDVSGLVEALDAGQAVMVAVDSGEYWTGESVEDDAPDHAVVVTGIDVESGIVYLSDTGTPDGNMLEVPLDVFEDAWADSDNLMVVCEQSAEEFQAAEEVDGQTVPAVDIESDADAAPAVDVDVDVDDASTSGTPIDLDDVLDLPATTPMEAVTDFVTSRPWILLPVAIGAGVALSHAAAAKKS
jgi:hypothetical protein